MTEKFSPEKHIKAVRFEDHGDGEGVAELDFDYNGVQETVTIELTGFYEDGEPSEFNVYSEGDEDGNTAVEDFIGKCRDQEATEAFNSYFNDLYKKRFAEARREAMQEDQSFRGSAKK